MPALRIQFTKKKDGAVIFRCVRSDGSVTWQRQEGTHAQFFPLHDLTHYAVETVLGHRRGFYGLVAGGWDVTDFGTPWPRGPLPADAEPTEFIVGMFDLERATGEAVTAADITANVAAANVPAAARHPALTQRDLDRIRALRSRLFDRWYSLEPGGTLELEFE
jgi:hypothetical protein